MDERNDPQTPPESSEGAFTTTPADGGTPDGLGAPDGLTSPVPAEIDPAAASSRPGDDPTIALPPVADAQTPEPAASSWVPGAAAPADLPAASVPTPEVPAAAGADDSTSATASVPSVPAAGPMPLSMPPFTPPRAEEPVFVAASSAGGEPPATPFGEPWPTGDLGGAQPPAGPVHRRRRAVIATVAAVALLAGGLGAGLGAAFGGGGSSSSAVQQLPTATTSPSSSSPATSSVGSIAASVEPGVVDIQTTIASAGGVEQAAGTGMIVTSSGQVLTNNHVVEDATSIKVSIAGRSGTYTAKVLGTDQTQDVALLQIEGVSNLPYVTLGDSSTVAVGDRVVAIGNALGLGGKPSVVSGSISATNRTITASDTGGGNAETLHGLLETSAQIAPGDSGGPLVNTKGQVIGMDTAAASADGAGATVGFAIPINTAKTIVQQIERGQASSEVTIGLSPFLGIYVVPSSASGGIGGFGNFPGSGSSTTPSTTNGVTISGVVPSSPAAQAGLQGGDVITSINGHTTNTWSALQSVVATEKPGDQVTVHYLDQSGTAQTATIQLSGLPK